MSQRALPTPNNKNIANSIKCSERDQTQCYTNLSRMEYMQYKQQQHTYKNARTERYVHMCKSQNT